jgi:hypothetical protein
MFANPPAFEPALSKREFEPWLSSEPLPDTVTMHRKREPLPARRS